MSDRKLAGEFFGLKVYSVRGTCKNCRFFDPEDPHRYPVVVSHKDDDNIIGYSCRRYPRTECKSPDEWCGEHQLKESDL